MDIQEYIQSGIIESYVLGLASPDELSEVEQMAVQHPEVRQAIDDFSTALEQQAIANAVEPPAELKAKVLSAIQFEIQPESTPVIPIKQNVIEESSLVPSKTIKLWRAVAAACMVLLVGSALLNAYLYDRYASKDQAYRELVQQTSVMAQNNKVYQTKIQELQTTAQMLANPAIKMVKLGGVKGAEQNNAVVMWDTKTSEVYLMPSNLTAPQQGKQYQLWAMVDGKPVDAGVLDPTCTGLCKMKNIPRAQAFAITLETEGGNPTPNLAALTVIGEI